MKVKKEYIILILIIVGLSVYLFMRSSDRTFYELPKISGLEQNQITKIEISKGGDSIVLNRKDNKWHLEPHGYLADTNKVDDMLGVFEAFTLTTLVSESKDYVRYDLHDEKRITVKAWQQKELKRNFDIGKSASSFRHTFVKLDEDSRVFHARGNFRGKFELTADNLRDKNVLSFRSADIREIQITKNKKSLKFVRSQVPVTSQQEKSDNAPQVALKFEWQGSDGQKGDDSNLNQLLTTLSRLKCVSYINDRSKETFSAPIYAVTLKGAQDYQLDIFAKLQKDADNYPAVSSASDYPFFLSDSQAQQIMKDPSDYLKKQENEKKQTSVKN
ncbi:MAG: DUF4340 domain-containing protein [Desulfobacterales bacterium]|jgi:hypothetical protein